MLIYIAAPYSQGDTAWNIRRACLYGDRILFKGHIPLIPHLSHLWHLISPKTYEEWIGVGIALMGYCDAVLRLPGESRGADREIAQAKEWCMLIYYLEEEIPDVSSLPKMRRSLL